MRTVKRTTDDLDDGSCGDGDPNLFSIAKHDSYGGTTEPETVAMFHGFLFHEALAAFFKTAGSIWKSSSR